MKRNEYPLNDLFGGLVLSKTKGKVCKKCKQCKSCTKEARQHNKTTRMLVKPKSRKRFVL